MARSILDCTCCSNHADWVAEDKLLANVVSFCNSFNKIFNQWDYLFSHSESCNANSCIIANFI